MFFVIIKLLRYRMKDIFSKLSTEKTNKGLKTDNKTFVQLVDSFVKEERKINKILKLNSKKIAKASQLFFDVFSRGGRIFFVGAGTSGRLGILEAAECPPTFGTSPKQIQAIIAGGKKAIFNAIEGAEDSKIASRKTLINKKFSSNDLLVGISASGKTSYVISAINYAKKLKSKTIFITCNKQKTKLSDIDIVLEVGPEFISGSTRLKSGTITKNVLNIITTTAMIKAERIFKNMMIDIKPITEKLRARAIRNLSFILKIDEDKSIKLLRSSKWSIRIAIVMYKKELNYKEAEILSKTISIKDLF